MKIDKEEYLKLKVLRSRVQLEYNEYKGKDKHLSETLSDCFEALSTLIKIKEDKLKIL